MEQSTAYWIISGLVTGMVGFISLTYWNLKTDQKEIKQSVADLLKTVMEQKEVLILDVEKAITKHDNLAEKFNKLQTDDQVFYKEWQITNNQHELKLAKLEKNIYDFRDLVSTTRSYLENKMSVSEGGVKILTELFKENLTKITDIIIKHN